MRERLLGALIGLARATDGNEHLISSSTTALILECLKATREALTEEQVTALLQRIEDEKRRMIPDCFACAAPCGKNNAYDMARLQGEEPQVRALKQQLLTGIQDMAARDCTETAERFFYKALVVIGIDGLEPKHLEPVVEEMQEF